MSLTRAKNKVLARTTGQLRRALDLNERLWTIVGALERIVELQDQTIKNQTELMNYYQELCGPTRSTYVGDLEKMEPVNNRVN